jgi:hypothetical protein
VSLVAWTAQGFESAAVLVPVALALSLGIALMQQLIRGLRRQQAWRATQPWFERCCVLVVSLAVTYGVWGFVFREGLPIDTYDHHIMIARAELLAAGLAEGRIVHWSHMFQGGDSLIDLYPVFLNYLTAVVHFLSPGDPRFVQTYTLVCIAAWWLRGIAMYALCRRFASPILSSLMALASLLEVGAEVQDGVWTGAILWGMIHNNAALTIGLFANAAQIDAMRKTTSRRLVVCALLIMLTTIAHPLGMLFSAVSTASVGLGWFLSRDRPKRAAWTLAASVVGLLLASFWSFPYTYALTHYGFNGSLPGLNYQQLGNGLFNARLPISSFAGFIGFGMIAVLVTLVTRRAAGIAMGVSALIFALLGLAPFLAQVHLYEYVPSFLEAQQRRMYTVLKTAVLVPAVILLVIGFRPLRRDHSLSPRRVIGRALLLGLLLLGPNRGVVRAIGQMVVQLRLLVKTPAPGPGGELENDTDNLHREAVDWIRLQREQDPNPTPWRMAMWNRWDPTMHVHWMWVQGVATGVPLVDYGWVSANFIGLRPREATLAGFGDWNIRYVMGVQAAPPVAGLVERYKVGPYRIWEVEKYNPDFIATPPGVEVHNLKVHDDTISFDVTGAPGEGAWVTVRSAFFPRWQAHSGNRKLDVEPVAPRPGALPRQDQIHIKVGDGPVALTCDAALPRFYSGLSVSLLAGLALLAGSMGAQRKQLEAFLLATRRRIAGCVEALMHRYRALPARTRRSLWCLFALIAFAAILTSSRRGLRLLSAPPLEGVGLTVSAEIAGQTRDCSASPLAGLYTCSVAGKALGQVEAALGQTPFKDDAGEFGKFWPGIQITAPLSNTVYRLHYDRAFVGAEQLELEFSTNGSFEVWVETDGLVSNPQRLANPANHTTIPLGSVRGVQPLTVALRALQAQTYITVRGTLTTSDLPATAP